MNQLTGVLLHMNPGDTDALDLTFDLDIKMATDADGQFKLRNLITFWKIWIKIVLARKNTIRGNLTTSCETGPNRKIDNLAIENRQSPGHPGTYRTAVLIGRITEMGRTTAKNLGFSQKLTMDFQTDNNFIIHD
jgi:hypothetical protein